MAHGHEAGPYVLTRQIGRLGINVDFLGQGLATVRKDLAHRHVTALYGSSQIVPTRSGMGTRRPGTGTKKKGASPDMLVPPYRSGKLGA